MAVATGQRTTGNVASSQRVIDMHKKILLLEPDAAPLLQISKSANRMRANDPKFSWHNDQAEQRFDAINNGAGYADNATSLVVDTGTAFAPEDIVYVPRTGEVISVTSISVNTLTVTRGQGSSTAAALVDNDPLLIIGTAAEEGDTSQAARSENPTKVDNYTQIFKTSVQLSGSLLSSANESNPHDWAHQQQKQGIEHKKDIEYAFMLGSPGTTTGGSGLPRRYTGGILHYASVNRTDAGGTLTEVEVETWLRQILRYNSNVTVFVSPLVLSVLNAFAASKLQTSVGANTYGVHVQNWVSGHGEIKLVKHNLLEGAVLGGYAIAVDFKGGAVAYRYLDGQGAPGGSRDTKLYANRQAPDLDGRLDEWITECGLQAGLPYRHGVLTGVTG